MCARLAPCLFALSLAAPVLAEGVSQTSVVADQVKPPKGGNDPEMPDSDGVSEEDAALYMAQDAVLSIFYHEMGHALIDILQAPVLGLEEDAADVLSALLINELWDEESSEAKLRATAAFWAASVSETLFSRSQATRSPFM